MTKTILRRTDLTLLAATAGIIIMSLVIIGSATHINTPGDERYWFVARQGLFAAVNIAMAAFLIIYLIYIRKPCREDMSKINHSCAVEVLLHYDMFKDNSMSSSVIGLLGFR